jgi:glycosyltransferase involved in cell wall biosynthesis
MSDRKKILFISDHPLVPSGVGTQAKYLIEGLLDTGRYSFVCLGGAVSHPDYKPQIINPEKYGENWKIFPVNGYGSKEVVRQMLVNEKPDALFFFTDPRFFTWLWEMEDEVRAVCPMIYWHVWDNDPSPDFNKVFYESTDHIAALSLKTYGLLQDLKCENFSYIPHSISKDLYKQMPEEQVQKFKRDNFGHHGDKKFILFWNNRNARRKMTGDVIDSFAKFSRIVGPENVSLMMHTSPRDQEGQDIFAVSKKCGVQDSLIISETRLPPEQLNMFYNVVDCTINIANNEGFGLSTLESLYAGTPIIVHMTGGLQFQIGDWWKDLKDFSNQQKLSDIAKRKHKSNEGKWFGVPVFPASRSCTGSQQIPYIYDDRVCHEDVVKALLKMYELGRTKRKELGLAAREWAITNFNAENMISSFDKLFVSEIEKHKKSVRQRYRIEEI